MSTKQHAKRSRFIASFDELASFASYSFLETLNRDPDATGTGEDYFPRQVFSGHYVPVKSSPLPKPIYVSHSSRFFEELGLSDDIALEPGFTAMFSGDMSNVPSPMRNLGWATGYALSIYGTEYTQQCPFRTGNAYGDGRAISVLEVEIEGRRWEMQLKGGGRTPYCRGADGRAVLRSSVREFLVQEHMHALAVPTSRSLSLFTSFDEYVARPWYSEGANYAEPDVMVQNPVAITTRVAPSFLRVGQLELFGRRARNRESEKELEELRSIVLHLIEREYAEEIAPALSQEEQLVHLCAAFRGRLVSLLVNWIRVGYCQGNFNSDNCAAGGFTLDYGPFGFCEKFDPRFQPWTGGGEHFSFFNQPAAGEANFTMFCTALAPLLEQSNEAMNQVDSLRKDFGRLMQAELEKMWAAKLGLAEFDAKLSNELLNLMLETGVDYTMLFRELSEIPLAAHSLSRSFYQQASDALLERWNEWLLKWRKAVNADTETSKLSEAMKTVNPKYTWREWLVVPAYEAAAKGDFTLIKELQQILNDPYGEQTPEIEAKFYQLRPEQFFGAGGVSHYSCSS